MDSFRTEVTQSQDLKPDKNEISEKSQSSESDKLSRESSISTPNDSCELPPIISQRKRNTVNQISNKSFKALQNKSVIFNKLNSMKSKMKVKVPLLNFESLKNIFENSQNAEEASNKHLNVS